MSKVFPLVNFRPQKRWGQNFLSSTGALTLAQRISFSPNQVVFEIGPGFGALTAHFTQRTRRLILLEKDPQLVEWLQKTYANFDNVDIYHGDVLTFNFSNLPALPLTVISNLPYNIATAVLQKLLYHSKQFTELFLTFPLPIAQRILRAKQKSSYLSVYVELFCAEITSLVFLPRTLFTPVPKIDSLVLHFVLRQKQLLELALFQPFLSFLKQSFAFPRKTLFNNLCPFVPRQLIIKAFRVLNLPLTIRAEYLTTKQFIAFFDALKK